MAAQELQGRTLGEKHRHYNQLVKQTVEDKPIQAKDFISDDNDVSNLIKIDVACKQRNVEFVLKVLQCEHMLYVSRAIKRSTWLITDPQYSHIINPSYLHTQLFPKMMFQASAKLLLQIRIYIKDENRMDEFYYYIKDKNTKQAFRWLPYCSLPLAVQEVQKYRIEICYRSNRHVFKRLCEKSIKFLEICIKGYDYPRIMLQETMFLLNTNTEKYLDIVESFDASHYTPTFGPKATRILMKICPQRILNKFKFYCDHLDLTIIARHFKPEELKEFIDKIARSKDMQSWLKYENFNHFVKCLPTEEQFDYIKNFFIQKSKKVEDEKDEGGMKSEEESTTSQHCNMQCSDSILLRSSADKYQWYRFAPFNVAFTNLCKLIRSDSSPSERIAMFGVLLSSAKGNPQDIETILQYYKERHINEPFKFKSQFVNMILRNTDTYRFNEKAWNHLNNLFQSMEVYIESDKDSDIQSCIEAIILYKILHNEIVPEIIINKFKFHSIKSIQTKITYEEKEKVFEFLFNYLATKIRIDNINSEIELSEAVKILEEFHILLKDWKKNLAAYPWLLEKNKNLIELRNTNNWKTNLSTLLTKNKSWRRLLFEESLLLSPTEETCYNILKHEPELLTENKNVLEKMRRDVSLRHLLRTLRVYWPQTMAADWTSWYFNELDRPGAPKSVFRGLFTLAPQQLLIDMLKKYAPTDSKINWSVEDEVLLNIRKHLARNMHMTRPLLSPEVILLYAKGDYLQFALPSINAVFHNMSSARTREHISELLVAPVSLQKHGIRFAFTKLESEELKGVFHNIWKNAKNPSIRLVLFKHTYVLLCRQTNQTMIQETWELLNMFIDHLSTEENKKIYEILARDYKEVPMLVRGKFFMKSFKVLRSLPPHKLEDCANEPDDLIEKMPDIIEQLDPEFVEGVLLENQEKIFSSNCIRHFELMASYLLCATDVEIQSERYRKVLLPVLERAFASWDEGYAGTHIKECLNQLTMYLQKNSFERRMIFPNKLFSDIHIELATKLPTEKHYELQTKWKLLATFVRLLEEHKDTLDTIETDFEELDEEMKKKADSNQYLFNPKREKQWNVIYLKAVPEFAKICLAYLKEDVTRYFPSVYWMFASAFKDAFTNINTAVYLECLESLLVDENFIPSYLVVIKNTPLTFWGPECDDYEEYYKKILDRICKKIFSCSSIEVRFYYLRKFTRHNVST